MGVWTVISVAVAAVIVLLGASLLLPVHFVFLATFRGTKFEFDAKMRLPLIPWYMRIPKPGVVRARKSRVEPSRSTRKSRVEPSRSTRHSGGQPSSNARQSVEQRSSNARQSSDKPSGSARQGSEEPPGAKAAPTQERLGAIWRGVQAFRSHYREISSMVSCVARDSTVEDFRMDVTVGLDEAAETALLAGAMQSAASVGIGLLCRYGIRFSRRPLIRVTPAYNRVCLEGGVWVQTSVVPMRAIIALGRLRSHLLKINAIAGKKTEASTEVEANAQVSA